jgi:hypothetical protein
MSALLGTSGETALRVSLGRNAEYFGSNSDPYREQYHHFREAIIEPIRKARQTIIRAGVQLKDPEAIRYLEKLEDLKTLPTSMMGPLITYDPLYRLMRQGRIYGWGYEDNVSLSLDKEMYDRLLSNNHIEDVYNHDANYTDDEREVRASIAKYYNWDEEDIVVFTEEHSSADSVMYSYDERSLLRAARRYMDDFLKDTPFDPTDPTELRG